ncbi:MAG: prephenate dehydrogenase/arogenate dehydrogenase family protein [Candidatus Limnocylindrales bacterium]
MIPRRPETVALLGLGLIGGSIARAVARHGEAPRVVAWTPGGAGPAQAFRDGVIQLAAPDPGVALADADLVVIAAPPLETVDLVRRLGADLADSIKPGALVTDVASTKSAVMAAAAAAGVRFVGGHPMAGRESSGYAASSADLFVGRPWVVVVPDGSEADIDAPVRWLAEACGAMTLSLSAADHDSAAAAVSHLPLVLAAILVEVVAADERVWPIASSLAASGWAGATRLARGDARMGAGIAATNNREIGRSLRAFRVELDRWIEALDRPGADDTGPDSTELERRFTAARATLEAASR